MMNERGKSDWPVVPGKPANKGDGAPSSAEQVEGRGQAKGNLIEQSSHRAQYRDRLSQALDRVRQAARRGKGLRFTTLWHHVYDVERLRRHYFAMKRTSAPGVDGETWEHYGEKLEEKSAGPLRTAQARSVSGEAGAQSLHPESRWSAATARCPGAGGQVGPTRRGGSDGGHLRG